MDEFCLSASVQMEECYSISIGLILFSVKSLQQGGLKHAMNSKVAEIKEKACLEWQLNSQRITKETSQW